MYKLFALCNSYTFLKNYRHNGKGSFKLEIVNSAFSNLNNSSVLYSYGETKEIYETVNTKRLVIVKNSTFSDNTGNLQLNMFNVVLKCLASCTDINTKVMNQLYRYTFEFSNCKFIRNINMKALISVMPPTTRTTVGNALMFQCTFTENKNMTFIDVKQEYQTMLYKTIYILLSSVNVSSNQHYYGNNLILITNVHLEIQDSFFNQNGYYDNIINLYSSLLFKSKYTEISSNYARHIIKAPFIFIRFLVTVNISHNVVYKVIAQVSKFERYAICPLQVYYSIYSNKQKSLHIDEVKCTLVLSSNLEMISKALLTKPVSHVNNNCKWLEGTIFQKTNVTVNVAYHKIIVRSK